MPLLLALLLNFLPLGPFAAGVPVVSAHAVLIRSQPSANQILKSPPSAVRMVFSEALNPSSSTAVVVDAASRKVEPQSVQFEASSPDAMNVSLPLLQAGTYVVAWRTQSADDGHIVGGSFLFRIAHPDGMVPPLPKVLPTGNISGGGGAATSGSATLDGPTLLQTLGTWLSELLLAFWLGGLLWETWILPPGRGRTPDLAQAATAAGRRFARLSPWALGALLVADALLVLGQTAELAGGWTGAVNPALLHAVLFGSRFGVFWALRQGIAIAAIVCALAQRRNPRRSATLTSQGPGSDTAPCPPNRLAAGQQALDMLPPPALGHEVGRVLRRVPSLPTHLVRGWRRRAWYGKLDVLLGLALLVAFALSGHAAAVPVNEFAYAVSVDVLHLLCTALWVGGLLYISLVLLPATHALAPHIRARVLADGLPEFSAVAIVSVVVLAATGTLNTTIHLTSALQVITTAYGRTLFVKSELFLLMVGISAYHAFVLRPRLAVELEHTARGAGVGATLDAALGEAALVSSASATGARNASHSAGSRPTRNADDGNGFTAKATSDSQMNGDVTALSARARQLSERIEDWLHREALLGVAVLACVALLAAFAGSLAAPVGASGSGGATSAPGSGPYTSTQTVSNTAISLHVTPATFGTNTFTVHLTDTHGTAIRGATVLLQTTALDMNMGTQRVQLKPVASTAGSYSGQADLAMAGHWLVVVKVLQQGSQHYLDAPYRLTAGT